MRKEHEADAAKAEANEAEIAKVTTAQSKAQADLDKAAAAKTTASEAHAEATSLAAAKQGSYEAAMGLGAADGAGSAKNLQGQLSEASEAVTSNETDLKTAEMRKKQYAKEVKETEKKLADARKSGGKQEKEYEGLMKEVAALRDQMTAIGYDESKDAEVQKQLASKTKELAVVGKTEGTLAKELGPVKFQYSDPSPGFDRKKVKGTVAANLSVKEDKNNTALEALAGGRLYQVIVDDEETGMQLLTKGNLSRRVTLIPLNKILPKVMPADKVAAAKKLVGEKKANLAVDLLNFNDEVAPAMQHVFGSALVCTDKDAARKVCDELGLKTVTLEGDLYDPAGTLTGGSRAKSSSSILQRAGKWREVHLKCIAIESEIDGFKAKLNASASVAEAYNGFQSALELKEHELKVKAETMRNSAVGQLAAAFEAQTKGLADAEAAAVAATEGAAKAKKMVKELTAQIKDFEGNREERMKKLKKEIEAANKEVKAKEKEMAELAKTETKAQVVLDDLAKELEAAMTMKEEITASQEQTVTAIEVKAAAEQSKRDEYDAAQTKLEGMRRALGDYDKKTQEITARRDELQKLKEDGQIELNKIERRCERFASELKAAQSLVKELIKKHPWIEAEKSRFGVAGTEYDFKESNMKKLQKELAKKAADLEALSKKINKKVLTMLESAEREYADLKEKKDIVVLDKEKIEAVITELAQKKIEALQKTWAKVNTDFGSIFETLLPGAHAKLDPQEGCPVEEGLIVKVGFGSKAGTVWKQSLQELSGGQRSLIALSLVLSLLRFKPAPVYILDEVDAALDLSHTQNIGKMIKAHFTQSQFLVVSLKEGMFNNANVIFRTKFVDNVSCVTRTVPNAAAIAAAQAPVEEEPEPAAAGKAGRAAGGKRGALASKN